MNNILEEWHKQRGSILRGKGLSVIFRRGVRPENCGVDIDSAKFVGSISYWPGTPLEFLFNDCKSGDVLILESRSFDDVADLDSYIEDLVLRKLGYT